MVAADRFAKKKERNMSVANAAAGGIHKEVASELMQYGGGEPVYTQANAAPRECSSINGKNGRVRQEKKPAQTFVRN